MASRWVWVGNYVLMGYGDGAVMAVPAHDERDFAFATKYGLAIKHGDCLPARSFSLEGWQEWYADKLGGSCVNSGKYDGLSTVRPRSTPSPPIWRPRAWARRKSSSACATGAFRGSATGAARFRSSTAPSCGDVPVPDADLPVVLPEDVTVTGAGSRWPRCPSFTNAAARNAASRRGAKPTRWIPSSSRRGTSCAIAARTTTQAMVDERVAYWCKGGIDQYIGGIEHAILHLLYSRFWTKLMRDVGLFGEESNLRRAFCPPADPGHGRRADLLPRGRQRQERSGSTRPTSISCMRRARPPGGATLRADGLPVTDRRHREDVQVEEQRRRSAGADRPVRRRHGAPVHHVRQPPDQSLEWSDAGVEGAFRFLKRLWRIVFEHVSAGLVPPLGAASGELPKLKAFRRQLHQTIGKVADDYGRRKQFNTAIAAVMELLNAYAKRPTTRPTLRAPSGRKRSKRWR
jgi:leucyl-tRNA synthetase